MALTKYHIGDLIEPYNKKCGIPNLMPDDVSGINIDKEFLEPAKQVGEDTSSYKLVPPNYFACNLMHVGRDEVLPIALNHTNHDKIVSPAYSVFKIKNEKDVLKEYPQKKIATSGFIQILPLDKVCLGKISVKLTSVSHLSKSSVNM